MEETQNTLDKCWEKKENSGTKEGSKVEKMRREEEKKENEEEKGKTTEITEGKTAGEEVVGEAIISEVSKQTGEPKDGKMKNEHKEKRKEDRKNGE